MEMPKSARVPPTQVQDVKAGCQNRSYRMLNATWGACRPWAYKNWRRAGQKGYSHKFWALRNRVVPSTLIKLWNKWKLEAIKVMPCEKNLPRSSAFRSQCLGHKNTNLCTVINSRLDAICNHARNALSKANNSESIKPLQCFCTGL